MHSLANPRANPDRVDMRRSLDSTSVKRKPVSKDVSVVAAGTSPNASNSGLSQSTSTLSMGSNIPDGPAGSEARGSIDGGTQSERPTNGSRRETRMAPGAILTGKQEHYLKRELVAQQAQWEISELNSPTALRRFGAPFRSDAGEVAPQDSELPLLRYIFVNHVRNFPFLDQANEEEFWQDKLQVFLESFATKRISSSEDRLEETKRKKLAIKAQKVVELMMVSGIPTASGYEERIRFAEIEVVDRGANEEGLVANVPEGRVINGWDVNVAGVRMKYLRRTVRQHPHAQFILRVKARGKSEHFVVRRYGDFVKMHKNMRLELPGKTLPSLPRKNKKSTGAMLGGGGTADDDDAESISSVDTQSSEPPIPTHSNGAMSPPPPSHGGFLSYLGFGGSNHKRSSSAGSGRSTPAGRSSVSLGSGSHLLHASRPSSESRRGSGQSNQHHVLHREEQRVSLRAFLRNFLQNEEIARSNAMHEFLTANPITPNQEELEDIARRVELDGKRLEEGRRFYEIARKRARELDVHMEKFRRDIVESNGLSKLFKEIKVKDTIAELSPEYQKFAEWLRIEVAATVYHLFLSEDNSPELFAQAKRIHSLMPYVALKNVIRFTNPAAVMKGVLDLFLAQPLGTRSLMQRIFGLAISDGVRIAQKQMDVLYDKIDEPILCEKLQAYVAADESIKDVIREESVDEDINIVVAVLRSDAFGPNLDAEHIGQVFNAYVAWNNVIENVDQEMIEGAELYAHLTQYLKVVTRQRDKQQMLSIIEESVTMQLLRDLFTIFYEPLVRVYKSANVYNSVSDFSAFADDAIHVIDAAQRQDVSADPNETVQAFIDLCARHEEAFYRFVHEVHIHDNGLFDQLMGWLEGILDFLRKGPRSGASLDMNALMQGAVDIHRIDKTVCIHEIDALIEWQMARKKWHNDKTRRKMAGGDKVASSSSGPGNTQSSLGSAGNGTENQTGGGFRSSDFGLNADDLQDLGLGESDAEDEREEEEAEEEADEANPIDAERKRRKRLQEALKSRAGEPIKPPVVELAKLKDDFVVMLRMVLAE